MKYYAVQLVTGEYDSMGVNTLFITDKEYKAKFYCSKGNGILKKYKDYFSELLESVVYDDHPRSQDYSHISDRSDFTMGYFGYHEIEFRKNIKVPFI